MKLERKRTLSGTLLTVLAIFMLTSCGGDGDVAAGRVSGVVTSIADGSPVTGATISDGKITATTDGNGAFSMVRTPGSHTLTATAAGFETTTRICRVTSGLTTTVDWSLTPAHGEYWDYETGSGTKIPADGMEYVILAWNDLGMHCAQDDYSYFLILPPYNTLHVQVFRRGGGVVTSGITVSYAFPKKSNSAAFTNFWTYAPKYGWTGLPPNVGLTGNGMSGTMQLDANGIGFVATGIPATPYDDDGSWDPYGVATVTVTDSSTSTVLQTAEVVVPVSTELRCENCHGTAEPYLNILQAHDRRSGTTLVSDRAAGTLHLCSECHADNILGQTGKPGVKSLSLAMHNFHKDKMNVSADPKTPDCYNCHPGPATGCLRGIMSRAGMSCRNCHGDMYGMAASLKKGRQPWLQEPKCENCHAARFRENPGVLFRNSVLANSPEELMNGKIYCAACHNSPHAEFTSSRAADNGIPQQLQGDSYWIWNCYVCHTDYMPPPQVHR